VEIFLIPHYRFSIQLQDAKKIPTYITTDPMGILVKTNVSGLVEIFHGASF